MKRTLVFHKKRYRTDKPFIIARGTKNTADQIIVKITEGQHTGIGTCVPYPRYEETLDSVIAQIEMIISDIEQGLSIEALQTAMPAGAARNAVDCALWDLKAKKQHKPVWELADLPPPVRCTTATTLSIAPPEEMGINARHLKGWPLLKMKLAGDGKDINRIQQVHQQAPDANLILDANEALNADALVQLTSDPFAGRIALIEQPVPAGQDQLLDSFSRKDILCADESFHTAHDVEKLATHYGAINIKLDKSGGFTEALLCIREAQKHRLKIMIGCMLGSSLAMAPAFILATQADYVDLDGPLLLAEDDEDGFSFEKSTMLPSAIWGHTE